MKYFIITVVLLFLLCCDDKNINTSYNGIPLSSIWGAIDSSAIKYDNPIGWMPLDDGSVKASNGARLFLVSDTSIPTSGFRISFYMKWHTSGDLTGIFLKSDTSRTSVKGYQFVLYPYQNVYKFIRVTETENFSIEEGDCHGNPVADWVTLSVKTSQINVQGINATEFKLYCNDSLLTTIRDTTIKKWHLGFGCSNWVTGGHGMLWYKNPQYLKE